MVKTQWLRPLNRDLHDEPPDTELALFPGSTLHAHMKKCEGEKRTKDGESLSCDSRRLVDTTLLLRGEWPLLSAFDTTYQALPIFHPFPPHIFSLVCVGESQGMRLRVWAEPSQNQYESPVGSVISSTTTVLPMTTLPELLRMWNSPTTLSLAEQITTDTR